MKKLSTIVISILIMFSIACDPAEILVNSMGGEILIGSGQVISEERALPDFDKVELEGSMNVEITQGPAVKCTVEGDDNILSMLKTEVRSNRLRIYMEHGISLSSYKTLDIYLEVPEITGAAVSGSGDITFTDVTGQEVEVSIDGSGDITGTGEVETLSAYVNGSGDIRLLQLYAKEASVEVNGSGDVGVNVSDSLEAEINGSGDIKYKGDPPRVTRSVNGSGDITALD